MLYRVVSRHLGGRALLVAGNMYESAYRIKENAMTVVDCGEYKVFYADFNLKKKFLGKNQQYMPTSTDAI